MIASLDINKLKRNIKEGLKYLDMTRPPLNCLYLECENDTLMIYSANGFQSYMSTTKIIFTNDNNFKCLLDVVSAKLLLKKLTIKNGLRDIKVSEYALSFKLDTESINVMQDNDLTSKYPIKELKRLLNTDDTILKDRMININEFREAIKECMIEGSSVYPILFALNNRTDKLEIKHYRSEIDYDGKICLFNGLWVLELLALLEKIYKQKEFSLSIIRYSEYLKTASLIIKSGKVSYIQTGLSMKTVLEN